MIRRIQEIPLEKLNDSVSRKILIAEGSLMMVEVRFKKGGVGDPHSHGEHEQASTILKGSFEVTVGNESKVLETGDSFYCGKNVVHGVRALEDSVILDVFTPIRQDFMKSGE